MNINVPIRIFVYQPLITFWTVSASSLRIRSWKLFQKDRLKICIYCILNTLLIHIASEWVVYAVKAVFLIVKSNASFKRKHFLVRLGFYNFCTDYRYCIIKEKNWIVWSSWWTWKSHFCFHHSSNFFVILGSAWKDMETGAPRIIISFHRFNYRRPVIFLRPENISLS